jgi:hypothetical protein
MNALGLLLSWLILIGSRLGRLLIASTLFACRLTLGGSIPLRALGGLAIAFVCRGRGLRDGKITANWLSRVYGATTPLLNTTLID